MAKGTEKSTTPIGGTQPDITPGGPKALMPDKGPRKSTDPPDTSLGGVMTEHAEVMLSSDIKKARPTRQCAATGCETMIPMTMTRCWECEEILAELSRKALWVGAVGDHLQGHFGILAKLFFSGPSRSPLGNIREELLHKRHLFAYIYGPIKSGKTATAIELLRRWLLYRQPKHQQYNSGEYEGRVRRALMDMTTWAHPPIFFNSVAFDKHGAGRMNTPALIFENAGFGFNEQGWALFAAALNGRTQGLTIVTSRYTPDELKEGNEGMQSLYWAIGAGGLLLSKRQQPRAFEPEELD